MRNVIVLQAFRGKCRYQYQRMAPSKIKGYPFPNDPEKLYRESSYYFPQKHSSFYYLC